MKKYLYTLLFLFTTATAIAQECGNDTMISVVGPNINCVFNDGSNIEDMYIDASQTVLEGVTNFSMWATAPPNEDGKEAIISLTTDGRIDFSDGPDINNDSIRDPRPPGIYCFTPIGYNQADIDVMTNNSTIQFLLGNCAMGGETLEEVINCLSSGTSDSGLSNIVPTVDTVLTIIEDFIAPVINYNPCIIMGEPYCLEVKAPGDTTGCMLTSLEHTFIDPLSLNVYPNPSNTKTTLSFVMNDFSAVEITVFDMLGRQVFKEEVIGQVGTNQFEMDVSSWSSSIYYYSVSTDNLTYTNRMMVEK